MTAPHAAGNAGDTIFALASGAGRSAIAIIRISGGLSAAIVARLCGALPSARRASLRSLHDPSGALLDRALVLWMPGPASYTGEDTAELHLHGGRAVVRAVTDALLAAGARPADAGEFTRRAFLAGRMDLLEAEAIADLAAADTQTQRTRALRQMSGEATTLVAGWATRLTGCLAFREALIDFPEDNLPETVEQDLDAAIARLASDMDAHLSRATFGERVRNGLVFAITGAPNVGKSSLFNALAKRDMAIVSPVPGTTRDTLEVLLDLGGVAVTLVDTAGLRDTDDIVEAEGVRRAKARAEAADLVLLVIEAGSPIPELSPGSDALIIASKTDLAEAPGGLHGVSVQTGAGIEALSADLAQHARRLVHAEDMPLLSRARHVAALQDTLAHLHAALDCTMGELQGEELRLALAALGRLSGRVDTEAVLDVVFGAFCIGK